MQSRSKAVFLGLLVSLAWLLTARAESPEANALWSIWNRPQTDPAQRQAVIDACTQFAKSYPTSPLTVVTRELAAWQLMQLNHPAPAAQILEGLLAPGPDAVAKAGETIARHWLTRLDREKVKAALRTLYNDRIEFPASFDAVRALPEAKRPPLTDRWGKAWDYHLAPFKHIPGVAAQHYVLESPTLGKDSDLGRALKTPYGSTVQLKPVRLLSGQGTAQAVVEFTRPGGAAHAVVLSAGTSDGDETFALAGETFLLLANGDYWLVVPPPK